VLTGERLPGRLGVRFVSHMSLVVSVFDGDQVKEDFINGGRGHPPKHLKFFLIVF